MNIAIYSDHLLPYSQTFVVEQAKSLKEASPTFIGNRCMNEIPIAESNKFCISGKNRFKEFAFKFIRYNYRLQKYIDQNNLDLIHAHFGVGGSIIYPTALKNNIPLIITYHGYDITVDHKFVKWSDPTHKLYTLREKELMNSETELIAVSKFIKKKLLEKGFRDEKIHQHYIGVDYKSYHKYYNPTKRIKNRIIFVGRLVEKKGLKYLYKALEHIKNEIPKIELVVIGGGNDNGFLEKFKSIENVKLIYKDVLPHKKVLQEINKSSIFCVPSVTAKNGDSEAFGMVFAEAMSLCLPVVSFAHGGIPEVVKHEKTGLLAEEKNYRVLAEYLLVLIEDESYASNLGKNGLIRIKNKFDIITQTNKLEGIYKKILRD